MKRLLSFVLLSALALLLLTGCGGGDDAAEPLTLAAADWESARFHNAVAILIVESAFGYEVEEIPASTSIGWQSLMEGEIDVFLEVWTDNLAVYDEDLAAGRALELATNFDDNEQGLFVPAYVIEGDAERGIAPIAPDLKTVKDLANYPELFSDPDDPDKGRIYGAVPGWGIDQVLANKVEAYGLDATFNYVSPGSESALTASFVSAYERGEPWVGYYWTPTWLSGAFDMILLEDDPYDAERFDDGYGEVPSVPVTVCMNPQSAEKFPDLKEFFSKYETSSALTAEALAHLEEVGTQDYAEAAVWFLNTHPELLDAWLTPEQAELVRAELS